jgi:hypothetical protein
LREFGKLRWRNESVALDEILLGRHTWQHKEHVTS